MCPLPGRRANRPLERLSSRSSRPRPSPGRQPRCEPPGLNLGRISDSPVCYKDGWSGSPRRGTERDAQNARSRDDRPRGHAAGDDERPPGREATGISRGVVQSIANGTYPSIGEGKGGPGVLGVHRCAAGHRITTKTCLSCFLRGLRRRIRPTPAVLARPRPTLTSTATTCGAITS